MDINIVPFTCHLQYKSSPQLPLPSPRQPLPTGERGSFNAVLQIGELRI